MYVCVYIYIYIHTQTHYIHRQPASGEASLEDARAPISTTYRWS